MTEAEHHARLASWRDRCDATLSRVLPTTDHAPHALHAAMRHAVLLGGKRMRPLLVYATGAAFGADVTTLDAPAAAVELIHAYSLVHDDLPAMDDDALRRGQPTVHVAFDEATAILAGDALQSLAFELLANAPVEATTCIAMLRELATASGARGMCGGQALDIAATGSGASSGNFPVTPSAIRVDIEALQQLHAMKTGALLRASVRLGAIAANVDDATRSDLDHYADALGLAFQIRDDLLDVESDSKTLGKTVGKDAAQDKATFPALLGVDASHARLREMASIMESALSAHGGRVTVLRGLGRMAIERKS